MLKIPQKIYSQDTVSFLDNLTPLNINPETHTLTYYLAGVENLTITSEAEGESFRFTFNADIASGNYLFQAVAINLATTHRQTVGSGTLLISASVQAMGAGVDPRTQLERMLEQVDAAISTRLAGGAVQAYSIKGRNLSRDPIGELIMLRNQLRAELSRKKNGVDLKVRFGQGR